MKKDYCSCCHQPLPEDHLETRILQLERYLVDIANGKLTINELQDQAKNHLQTIYKISAKIN